MSKVVKAVGKAAGSLVKGAVNLVKSAVKAVGKVVGAVVDFVGQAFMGLLGGVPDMGDAGAEASKQDGVLVQKKGSNVNIPVVYGVRKVGGIVTYSETGSTDNKYLWVAYVFSEGPIEGLGELFIDDNQFTLDVVQKLNAGETVSIAGQPAKSPTEKYNGRCQFRFFPGTYYNTPSQSPIASSVRQGIFAGAPEFTDRMVYNGLAVLFARYEWKKVETQADSDNNPFNGGIPEIQATIMGRKIEGLTTKWWNGLGAIVAPVVELLTVISGTKWEDIWPILPYDRNAGRWSNNPAEILFDYLRNPQYGKGLKIEDFDRTTWVNAANKCATPVTYYTGIRGPILTCNYVLDTGQSIFNNTKALLTGFRAFMPYIQGKYKLKIEDAGHETDILSGVATIVQQVSINEIVGDITYTGKDRTDKYNHVVINYVDPAQKWSVQQVVWPDTEAKRQVYIAEDGGRENKTEITFGTITNSSIAQDMARLIFNRSRFQETCSFKISAQGFELEPGDNITIKGNVLDLTDTPWRVVSTKLNNDYTVEIGCVRNSDNVKLEDGTIGSFYPYGRYLEPDIIRPLYVPKGNLIYWPGVGGTNWGLMPPSSAPYPTDVVTVPPGNTLPTNPTDPVSPGGGNGSGGAAQNGTATPPVTNPVVTVTKTWDEVVDFTGASFSNNSWTVAFSVPSTLADYDGLLIWYQPSNIGNASIFYQLPSATIGARNFTFPASDSDLVSYNIIARIKYQGGNSSSRTTTATLNRGAGLVNERVQNYTFDNIVPADTGFVHLDAEINLISAYVNASALPKSVTFTFAETQLRYSNGNVGSTMMSNAVLYYKPGNSAFYKEYVYNLPSSYAANQQFSFTVQDFGITATEYDIILRWKFKDGRLGNVIFAQKINVTATGTIAGAANGVTLASTRAITVATTPTSSGTAIPTVNDIQGINGVMKIYFRDPSVSPANLGDWIGIRVDIATISGANVSQYKTYKSQVTGGLVKTYGEDEYSISINDYGFSAVGEYKIVVTLTYINSGIIMESSNAVKYSGKFYSSGGSSQINNFVRSSDTNYSLLIGDGGTTVAVPITEAVCTPSGIYDIHPSASGARSTDSIKVKSFQVMFTLPPGATALRVYRKVGGNYEYTDITTSGQRVRYGIDGNSVGGVLKVGTQIYAQTLYLRLYAGATGSSKVLRISPQYDGSNVNIMSTLFVTSDNTLDLAVETVLASAFNTATNAATRLVTYSTTDLGFTTGMIP